MSEFKRVECYQGDTVPMGFTVLDYDGTAQNLTSCSIRWGYATYDAQDTPLLVKTQLDGITILDAAAGRLLVNIDAGELDTPGTYVHELELTLPTGSTYTYGQGIFVVKPAVYPTLA